MINCNENENEIIKKQYKQPISRPGLPGLKPRFYLLLYDFFGPDSMTFYD